MKMIKFAAACVLVLLVSACVAQSNPYQMEFAGSKLSFRSNLDRAKDVMLSDGEAAKALLLDPGIPTIILAYVPDNATNGFYTVAGYELSYKLTLAHQAYFGSAPDIKGVALNTTEEAYAMATIDVPVILMKAGSDRTAVTVDGDVIIVEGKDMTENGRDYTDLDLAADRLLLEILKV
ncbi:MAG: hypothetical protein QXD77_02480 [Candidatus Aenigmatarchaeota archaeon]